MTESNLILIVVNTTDSLGILFDYLKGFGFRVLIANDGESTLSLVAHMKPHAILMDIALPHRNGFEVCEALKANPDTRNIPVIFIADRSSPIDRIRAFKIGAVDYITRPIQAEEVLARLKTHLTLQRLQAELTERNTLLQAEIEEREKLISELDAFAHTVAHDLKNPLGTLISYAQFISSYCTRLSIDQLQEYTAHIMRNGHKMVNIIDELLLLSSVRKEEIDLEPIDMATVVSEAQERLAYIIKEHHAEIITPSEWPVALGHASWVEEIWTNYLSNAIKYGGRPPQAKLGATEQANGTIKFWVKDNGNGLTPEQLSRLFIPFTRLNQVSAEGHGLGLSIVQRITEKLGGEVSVESDGIPGEGSIFSFTLPKPANGTHENAPLPEHATS